MKRILFLIHDLGVGGAEKVLVNLVNQMDRSKFDITVASLFGGGVNEQFLAPHIHYYSVWPKALPGNSQYMKLLSPRQLHRLCVKEHYDIEVAYLEGPAARVISGCEDPHTKLFCWIHSDQTERTASYAFRSFNESRYCYNKFDQIACVSEGVKEAFLHVYPENKKTIVKYNTLETDKILEMKDEPIDDISFFRDEIKLIAVGKISKRKGFDRLARIVKRLREDGFSVHLYALGVCSAQEEVEKYIKDNHLERYYTFLGYQTNPYKYMAKCDLFVCASLAEGFSTAATEALIVGTPVCTVNVSGMKEMLGENNEFGIITESNEEALYEGIKELLENPDLLEHYRKQAEFRGKRFSTESTVNAVEEMLLSL